MNLSLRKIAKVMKKSQVFLNDEKLYNQILFLLNLPYNLHLLIILTTLADMTSMQNLLPELQQYKDRIPEFIMKLYHILQKKDYEQYLTWFGDDQILIKHPKKFEEKVLPKYFRHKHLSSFIRQLNMYKFNKVSKIIKEKNHMYFKNEHFIRGDIEQLLLIKRNTKKNRGTADTLIPDRVDQISNSENVSINEKLHQTEKEIPKLEEYKQRVKSAAEKIHQIINKVTSSNVAIESQLRPVLFMCEQLMQAKKESYQSFGLSSSHRSYEQLNLLNCSQIALPKIQAGLGFPSQCSLYNFGSLPNN